MSSKHEIWRWPAETVWQKYCGFLDLSLAEFNQIQRELLMDELLLVHSSGLGQRLLQGSLPRSIDEFRRTVPLTTYADYQPELASGHDGGLPGTPIHWAANGCVEGQRFPYTQPAYDVVMDNVMAALILSCATRKGEVNLRPEDRLLWSAPPRPLLSGLLSFDLPKQFGFPVVVDPAEAEAMEPDEKMDKGFRRGLATGMDILVAKTSMLVKMGGCLDDYRTRAAGSIATLHPNALTRLAKGYMSSRLLHREMMPKDLWWPKAMLAWDVDSPFHREQLEHYWGQVPYQVYSCAEGGVLALQAWNKKGMTLVPYANFYEFIPEGEAAQSRMDPHYQPATLLLDELEEGKRYELVVTNLHGMPLLRYRVGHLIRVSAMEDVETEVRLPQIEFEARIGDGSGLAKLNQEEETALWEALIHAQLGCTDWVIRQEMGDEEPFLHLYGEFYGELTGKEIADALYRGLRTKYPAGGNGPGLLANHPLRVTRLPEGAFAGYQNLPNGPRIPTTGARPSRLNATDAEVAQLLTVRCIASGATPVGTSAAAVQGTTTEEAKG